MKNTLVYAVLFLLATSPVVVAENHLPDPGILPDSPFYGLKKAFESVGTAFTFGDEAKIVRSMKLAEKRLAEVEAISTKGKPEFADKLLKDYEDEIKKAQSRASRASVATDREALLALVSESTSRQLGVLDEVLQRVPEQARASIIAAKERSMEGNVRAIEALGAENPGRARTLIEKNKRTVSNTTLREKYEQLEGRLPEGVPERQDTPDVDDRPSVPDIDDRPTRP